MRNFNLKLAPETDLNVGGYGAGAAPTKVPPPPAPSTPPPAAPAEASGDNDNLDEYGYEKVAPTVTTPDFKTPAVETKKAEAAPEIKEPVAGYGVEPVKAEVPPVVPPVVEEVKLAYEVDAKDLPKEDADRMKKFALDQKLPKEVAQALVDLKKTEYDTYKNELTRITEDAKQKVAAQKASWDSELRNDPIFGGDQFLLNLSRADKVLTTLMPDTKKELTKRGSMLPPYVMRDLIKVHNHMYGTDSLVQGENHAPEAVAKESSPLDFYE